MKFIASLLFISAIYFCGVFSDSSKLLPLREYYERHSGEPRITGGIPAVAGQFPWQVLIRGNISASLELICGGSIINDTKILTAAHCVSYDNVQYRIYAGGLTSNDAETGSVLRRSTNYYAHPDYNETTLTNDVGMIVLDEPLTFTSANIQPVRLPESGETVLEGETVRVSGWGVTSNSITAPISPVLNWANLTTISNTACQGFYGSIVQSSTLCAVGSTTQSTCSGDSGGPMVTIGANGTATLVGVTSFVSTSGCGVGFPAGFVRTEAMLDFINSGNDVLISKVLLAAMVLMKVFLR